MNYQDLSKTEVEYLIDEWVIGKYAERDRAIMRRRLIDGVYNRLKSCPVPSMPVYGNQPIFTCGGNTCGCGGNAFVA